MHHAAARFASRDERPRSPRTTQSSRPARRSEGNGWTASSRRSASTPSGWRAIPLRGSAALATYRRFVIPKTAKGLRDALAPARAASVAVDVVGLARQHLAEQAAWLRNRDRSLEERPEPPHADLVVVLDGLRSGENVGSVLRSVETAGAGRVICCGTTPAPPSPSVLRAAMGCADLVTVERAPSTLETVAALRRDGFAVWACETTERSVSFFETPPPRPLALIFGHEEFGVSVGRSTCWRRATPSSRFPSTA